ncbi:MAG: MFS transporter [Deltaproteobacteria bacterium]|nr:MFS transporter [Deltaproteobacteria bacterium]
MRRWGLHWAWVILGVCFVDLFINYSARLGYGVVLPEMIKHLGFSRTQGGSVYNAYLFTYVAVTPLTGFLTDRLGARRVISFCALLLGLGLVAMGTADSLVGACLAYAAVGLGATGMWTPVITVVQRWFIPRRRGLALGILSAGYGLGFAFMGLAFPWIVQHYSWRHSWYFLGAAALVMVLGNGIFLRSSPEAAGRRPWGDRGSAPQGLDPIVPELKPEQVSVLKSSTFWMIGASYFAVSYSLYGITTFMVDYAEHQLGLSLEKASLLATIHGSCQVLGVLTVLPLSDVLGRRRTILLSNTFIALALAGILFWGHSWPALTFFVGLLAVFYGVTFPIYGACAGDYFPKEVMGTVIGAWTPFYGLGAIVVHWVAGSLRDATGQYDIAFVLNIVMAVAGVVLMFLVKKDRR